MAKKVLIISTSLRGGSNSDILSAEQLACVNGADTGMGHIRFGDKIVPFDNTMKKDSELYQLFNTNFHEIAGATR